MGALDKIVAAAIALALVSIAPARALLNSHHKNAQAAVSPSDARDLMRQADSLIAEANQIG
jgi:hypothetical protein